MHIKPHKTMDVKSHTEAGKRILNPPSYAGVKEVDVFYKFMHEQLRQVELLNTPINIEDELNKLRIARTTRSCIII